MERVLGIEPTLFAWEAEVLPLNYTRVGAHSKSYTRPVQEKRSIRRAVFMQGLSVPIGSGNELEVVVGVAHAVPRAAIPDF